MNVSQDLYDEDVHKRKPIPENKIIQFQENYKLRTWTSGCYFYSERLKAWIADGMRIRAIKYGATHCKSDHLTSFAAGFFVIPNSIDFDYIFANASFHDNLTIYIAIIITLILYIMTSIWARYA